MGTLLKHAQNADNSDKKQMDDNCSYNFRRVTEAEHEEWRVDSYEYVL